MKEQVIINGVPYIVLSSYNWLKDQKDMSHDLGVALLSPSGSVGFVPYNDKWLMFRTKDYEGRR